METERLAELATWQSTALPLPLALNYHVSNLLCTKWYRRVTIALAPKDMLIVTLNI